MDDNIYPTQDPKYGIRDNRLVNMETGKPIPTNEPVFMFRAKGKHAADILSLYGSGSKVKSHKEAVFKRARDFSKFRDAHDHGEPT